MTWISVTEPAQATGRLAELYSRVAGSDGRVDNILAAHSLRPHTLQGHMALYKSVLHHSGNTLPAWYLECLGVYVSALNQCEYCVDHHFAGLQRLLTDDHRARALRNAMPTHAFDGLLELRMVAGMHYARKLTEQASAIVQDDIVDLRDAGLTDGEILEINQVTAYFSYANRTVLGLGVTTTGDVLGLSPSERTDSDDWSHK